MGSTKKRAVAKIASRTTGAVQTQAWPDQIAPAKPRRYAELGIAIGEIVEQKNAAYGNSVAKSGEFLRLLFPGGVPADRGEDVLLLVRIFDKQMRIATSPLAFGESPYLDIAGYGLLGAEQQRQREAD